MRVLGIISFFILIPLILKGQSKIQTKTGLVTFKASNNIYVRFDDTKSIKLKDTIYVVTNETKQACMIVEKMSSSSCVCSIINNCDVQKDDQVFHYQKIDITVKDKLKEMEAELIEKDSLAEVDNVVGSAKTQEEAIAPKTKEKLRARISAASNSTLSSVEDKDRHRAMLRLSLNAYNINDSKFSFESYFNYRKNFLQGEIPSNYKTSIFNVFNLALIYDLDPTMSIAIGRKINRKIASIGPVDGIQMEKHFGSFYTGGIIGFKPDINGFGFNSNLLEFGGYIGYEKLSSKLNLQTTIGLLEQKNGGAVDRRYLYLQHNSTIARNLSLFSSIELDFYQKVNNISSADTRLTNLFLSARYRVNRKLSFTLSFDTRKRIIFYETLRTEVEELLADDQARKGIRGRVNLRPFKYVNAGLSYNKRFQSDNQNKSDNINGFISYSKLPLIKGRLSINFNLNQSNYLESKIISIRHSRTLIKNYLNGDFYFRVVNYKFGESSKSAQKYMGGSFSLRLSKTLRFSLLSELSIRESQNNVRINTKLIKRIKSK